MNKQNSKHIKTIQKKNKQYDDGGNLLSTIGGTVGSTIGSAITTSLDDGRHTGIGDFLIGASPLAGTLAVQALNNKSNKKINKIDPYKTPDFVNAQDPHKVQEPANYGAFGGQFLTSLGAGMASSLLMGGIGSLVNKAFGNNKQAINQRNARIQQAYNQAANISNINNYDDMANTSIDTGFSVNRGEYGWFNGDQYRKDLEGANASKDYLASVIPNTANKINMQNDLSLKQNYASFGGNLNTAGANFTTGMKHINTGDTHENNPYEGVPMGVDPQGTPNLVEEGETIYNDYVFSDRLKVPKQKIKKGQTKFTQEEKVLHKYEGKTYADAAKKAEKDSGVDERPNDNIAKRGFETILEILAQSQEQQRAEEDKEKIQQQLEALQEYLNSLPPEEREQIIQQIQQQLTGQEVPQQEIPQQVQQQGVPQDQQQMMQQQQQLSPEEIAMMQQQQSQQQEMSPEQQTMLQQQMQQQPPIEEQPMQEPQQQVQTQAYGGKLYEEGGQLSPEQMAMLQQQQGTPQQEVTPPTEPQSPQDLPPEYQGQEVPQGVEEVPQEGQQGSIQEIPQETPQEQIEQSPAEMIDTNVNPEDMSTTELNKKIDEIIRYAKDTQDKQLAREARKIKKKGTRTEKEEFVQETLEEIKEEQDQIRQDKAVKEENIKQQQAQQQQLAEEQAAQMQQQQQMPQEEQVPQEAMQQEEVPQEAVQADAGQALDAQEVPQEMQETPMMANGGKLCADGGAINMGAVLAAIFEKNKNNPAMMSKFRRLQNCTDPQLQNDIAREIIELDRNSSYSCGGKLYADGGDISSQVAQAIPIYDQIAEKDPNITQLFDQILKSVSSDTVAKLGEQGIDPQNFAKYAAVTQYMQQYQNNQAANGGKLFEDGGVKASLIENYAKLMKPLVEGEISLTHRDDRTNDLRLFIWEPMFTKAFDLYKTIQGDSEDRFQKYIRTIIQNAIYDDILAKGKELQGVNEYDTSEKIKNYINENWNTLDNHPELRQTLIDILPKDYKFNPNFKAPTVLERLGLTDLPLINRQQNDTNTTSNVSTTKAFNTEKDAQDKTANTTNISSENQVNTDDIQKNVQQPKEEDSKAENNISQDISPDKKVAIEKATEIIEKQKKVDEKIEELVDGLLKSSGIRSKKLSPELQAYRANIKAQLKNKLPEILQNDKDISDISINDIKDLNLLGTEGLNKKEARKTVLNNANIYNQQQSLIGKGFKEGALDNNTLSWYGYNSPVTVRDINPYKAFTAEGYDGKQLYLDPNTGLVYNKVKEGYNPNTPFDINTNGKLYTGTYWNLADQGFYRTYDQDLDKNPFIKESNYNIDKAKMDFVKYYNDKMFQFVAQSRGKADKKGRHVYQDKSGKLYYIDKSTNKKIYKTDNTSDLNKGQENDEWRKVFLTGKELREWKNQLENGTSEKEKFLANSIKKTWGPNLDWSEDAQWHLRHEKDENGKDYGVYSTNNQAGYLTETDEYLDDIDPRTGKPYRDSNRTSDNVNGKHHSGTFGVDNTIKTYWVNTGTAENPEYKQVVLNQGININDYSPELIGQKKDANGWNIQRYLINDNKKRYAIKSGDKVYTIDADNFDPASVGLKTTTVVPYKDQNIPGLNGKTTWLEFDKDSKTDSTSPLFPFPSKVPLLAGIGLQAGTTLFNALKPIDYSNADALANLAATTGRTASTISPVKIGDYLTYRPVDRNFIANQTLAQANNINRTLAGLSGGNRGTAAANILGNDYNTLVALGTDYMNAYEKNREQEQKVAQFNRETNKLNADWQMAADRANQDAYNNRLNLQANLNKDAINMRNTLETNKGSAISAGLTGLANLVYNLYQDDYNKKLQKYSIDMGNAGSSTRYEYPKTSGAKGGKLRTRRKRTFNI